MLSMEGVEQFCIYAHEDISHREQLDRHFESARRAGLLIHHADRDIDAGGDWRKGIHEYLKSADIILLLVSSDFFNSDYAYETEMMFALERHRKGEAVVIPVILRPCEWTIAPFAALNALPPYGKAITEFPNADEGYRQVVAKVIELAVSIQAKRKS